MLQSLDICMLRLNLKRHPSVPGLIQKIFFFKILIWFTKFYDPRGLPVEKFNFCAKVGILIHNLNINKWIYTIELIHFELNINWTSTIQLPLLKYIQMKIILMFFIISEVSKSKAKQSNYQENFNQNFNLLFPFYIFF